MSRSHGSTRPPGSGSAATVLAAALALLVGACASNPAAPGHEEGEFSVEVTYTPDHVHTLQSEVTFTVTVRDHDGNAVTDFEAVQLERLAEGSDTWRAIELAPAGDAFVGTYTFTSSGEYHLRVMAQHHGETEMSLLHELHDPVHVARAHAEAGGYRIEFESFPGHIHEGETAAVTFWVMEPEADEHGERHPIEGLSAEVHVAPEGDQGSMVEAHEHGPGEYEAEQPFAEAGEYHVGLHFTDASGQPAEAEFHVHVVHGH